MEFLGSLAAYGSSTSDAAQPTHEVSLPVFGGATGIPCGTRSNDHDIELLVQPFSVDGPKRSLARPPVPHPSARVPNPYRAPKPTQVLFQDNFEVGTLEGFLFQQLRPTKLRLSQLYLWLEGGASIPLSLITNIELIENESFLAISYEDVLNDTECSFKMRPRKFMNLGAKAKLQDFWKLLEEARAVAPNREDFLGGAQGASKYVSFGCEGGDQEPARLLTLRKYYSIGIPVLAYISYSETNQHLLCELHGSRKALSCGLTNGVLGWLGLAGLIFSPITAYKNATLVRAAYPNSSAWLRVLAAGFTLPVLVLIVVVGA